MRDIMLIALVRGECMGTNENSTKRNYGIDLLRIISMFMVVVLHVLGARRSFRKYYEPNC